jgi:hypothetical protein
MAHEIKWKIKVERLFHKTYEVTAATADMASGIALEMAKKECYRDFAAGQVTTSVDNEEPAEWSELDQLMVPLAMFTGSIVTSEILSHALHVTNTAREEVTAYQALARKALESNASWFRVRNDSHGNIIAFDPIRSVADAKSMGYAKYKIPGFPKKFHRVRNSMVGHQKFTYEELYTAWKDAMEQQIDSRANDDLEYPFFLDIRGYPDNGRGRECVECGADDIESIMTQMRDYPQAIDACCFTFYANDTIQGEAYDQGCGFHVENGCLTE